MEAMEDTDLGLAPTATGILQCLKMLAAEAASLKLLQTLSAIEDALEMAVCESGLDGSEDEWHSSPARPVLH